MIHLSLVEEFCLFVEITSFYCKWMVKAAKFVRADITCIKV